MRDSLRIYALILKFLLSSGAATIIDLLLFYVLSLFLPQGKYVTLEATVLARAVSSLVNFSINRNVVFRNGGSVWKALVRYYSFAIPVMLASAGGVTLLGHIFGTHAAWLRTIFKMLIDTVLYFISFRVQREWVFRQRTATEKK